MLFTDCQQPSASVEREVTAWNSGHFSWGENGVSECVCPGESDFRDQEKCLKPLTINRHFLLNFLNSILQDPENGKVTYEKVSGALPPGVNLDKNTGAITGRIPDVDATYEFGIRVTDSHGKYADQIFSIDTRG